VTITALLELTLKADSAADAPRILATTLEATRAFAGNQGVEVLYDVTDPNHVVVIERWASLEHDDAYRTWRATPEGASELGTLLAERPRLTRWNSSLV
jgi:heme oxygenase (mycobilin-producing)